MSGGQLPSRTLALQGQAPAPPSSSTAATIPSTEEMSSQIEEAAKRASVLEDGLRQYEAQLSAQAPKTLIDTMGDIREDLIRLYEYLLLEAPGAAVEREWDTRLWRSGFHRPYERLYSKVKKKKDKKSQIHLDRLLIQGIGFYSHLLGALSKKQDSHTDTDGRHHHHGVITPLSMALIRQSSLIHLGDLLRYRNRVGQEARPYLKEENEWADERVRQVYLQAAYSCPPNGRGHGRMALLSRMKEDIPGTLYWSFLSLAKPQPSPIGPECIASTEKLLKKDQSRASIMGSSERSSDRQETLDRVILDMSHLQCHLFSLDLSQSVDMREGGMIVEAVLSGYQHWMSQVENCIVNPEEDNTQKLGLPDDFSALFKMIITLEASLTFWNERTLESEEEHRMIQVQSLLLSLLLHFLHRTSQLCLSLIDTTGKEEGREGVDGCITLLSSLATFLGCSWDTYSKLLMVKDQNINEYSNQDSGNDISLLWLKAVKTLADAHRALGSPGKDVPCVILPEDRMLFGFPPLATLHKGLFEPGALLGTLQSTNRVQGQEQEGGDLGVWGSVRHDRIGGFLAHLFHHQLVPGLIQIHETGGYLYEDPRTKELNQQRRMAAMAEARLKEQVQNLESQLRTLGSQEGWVQKKRSSLKRYHALPVIVCDTSVFVYRLPLLQQWIRRSMYQVVLISEVIDELDRLKKGTEKVHRQARSAIRWLDQVVGSKEPLLLTPPREEMIRWPEIVAEVEGHPMHEDEEEKGEGLYPLQEQTVPLGIRGVFGYALYQERYGKGLVIMLKHSPSEEEDETMEGDEGRLVIWSTLQSHYPSLIYREANEGDML